MDAPEETLRSSKRARRRRKAVRIAGAVVTAAVVSWLVLRLWPLPELAAFEERRYSVRITDGAGRLLRISPVEDGIRRERTPIEAMPPQVVRTFIGAEDRRFRYHPGSIPWRLRAPRVTIYVPVRSCPGRVRFRCSSPALSSSRRRPNGRGRDVTSAAGGWRGRKRGGKGSRDVDRPAVGAAPLKGPHPGAVAQQPSLRRRGRGRHERRAGVLRETAGLLESPGDPLPRGSAPFTHDKPPHRGRTTNVAASLRWPTV